MTPAMKIYQRGLFLLLSFHVISCLVSCCDEVDCVESKLNRIEVMCVDNTGPSPLQITADSTQLSAAGYKMTIAFFGEETHRGPCVAATHGLLDWFQNRALATSCPHPEYSSPDTLQQIIIRSTKNFNPDYPAGSNLFGLFIMDQENESAFRTLQNMPHWNDESGELDLLLFATPDSVRMHQFMVDVYMTSGRVISDTTIHIALAP